MIFPDKVPNSIDQIEETGKDMKAAEAKSQASIDASDDQNVQQKPGLSLRLKGLIGSIIVLILLGVGLGVGLYFKLQTKLEPIGPITFLDMGTDGKYAVGKFQLKETNLFTENQQIELILTNSVDFASVQGARRLQTEGDQAPQSDYRAHANIDQTGIQLTFTPDQKMGFSIEPQALANYLIATEPEAQRLLNEIISSDADLSDSGSMKELQENLTQAFNEEFGLNNSIQFKETQKVELKFNTSTLKMELVTGTEVQTNARRVLLVRLLSWRKFWRKVGRALKKVVVPIVNLVRTSGAIIGGVAGGIIGGVVAGPAGAVVGFGIGTAVGVSAQALVQGCVPKDTLNFKCTKEQAKGMNVGVSVTAGGDCKSKVCGTVVQFDSPPVPMGTSSTK